MLLGDNVCCMDSNNTTGAHRTKRGVFRIASAGLMLWSGDGGLHIRPAYSVSPRFTARVAGDEDPLSVRVPPVILIKPTKHVEIKVKSRQCTTATEVVYRR